MALLDDLKCWFEATLVTLSAKSYTTWAIWYALNRWLSLGYYYDDGLAKIDNLIAERALRGVVIRITTCSPVPTPAADARPECIARSGLRVVVTALRER